MVRTENINKFVAWRLQFCFSSWFFLSLNFFMNKKKTSCTFHNKTRFRNNIKNNAKIDKICHITWMKDKNTTTINNKGASGSGSTYTDKFSLRGRILWNLQIHCQKNERKINIYTHTTNTSLKNIIFLQ